MKGQNVSFRWLLSSPLTLPAATREGGAFGLRDGESSLLWWDRQRQTSIRSVKTPPKKARDKALHPSVPHLDLSRSIFCSSSLHLPRSFSSSCLSDSTFDSSLSFLSSSSETDNRHQTLELPRCARVWTCLKLTEALRSWGLSWEQKHDEDFLTD